MPDAARAILLIEDDVDLCSLMRDYFARYEYRVEAVHDGRSGLARALEGGFDLIILDGMLPALDGFEVLRQLRKRSTTPVIMLTARTSRPDRLTGLNSGADDYLPKPFDPEELLARIRAVLRRQPGGQQKVLNFADVEVNLDRRTVTRRNQEIRFTPAEYNLLTFFLQNPDRPLSRDMILNSVWGYESFPNTRTVDAHVVRLRQKLEADPNCPRHFLTLHKVGYRFLP